MEFALPWRTTGQIANSQLLNMQHNLNHLQLPVVQTFISIIIVKYCKTLIFGQRTSLFIHNSFKYNLICDKSSKKFLSHILVLFCSLIFGKISNVYKYPC